MLVTETVGDHQNGFLLSKCFVMILRYLAGWTHQASEEMQLGGHSLTPLSPPAPQPFSLRRPFPFKPPFPDSGLKSCNVAETDSAHADRKLPTVKKY